ncbi:BamA/TamA family outer membrane protein [Ancylomarina sp. 16SWW S1-10-2]|uniref:BamA/TamA family outer membrane protein n=1 Tax=Ancylomarina sp. 16SWW S1-10-2 TaxID=2499681 RepID=UPI0018A02727|nr:BamA/TamA family outer membrane protein [Ancylomarina sp. 16SWW S1-10-2]
MLKPIGLLSQPKAYRLKLKGSELPIFKKQARDVQRYRFDSETILMDKLEHLKSFFIEKGFLETSVDSTYQTADTIFAIFHIGKPYQWEKVSFLLDSKVPDYHLDVNSFDGFSLLDGESEQVSILEYYINHAHPFATIKVSDIEIDNGKISGTCLLRPNQKVVWDTMFTRGNATVNSKFIENYLDIKVGEDYSEHKFESISQLISKLDFVSEIKPSELEFFDGLAKVHNYLKKQSANRFDGIIGFQNNSETDKLEFIGEINLSLLNSFHRGELIQFNWEKLEESSQNLNIVFQYPYIFNSKLGTDFSFQLLKQDSTYVNTNLRLGLDFKGSSDGGVKLFYQLKSSSLISSKQYVGSNVLPDFADSKSNLLGFQYEYENLDRKYNSHKGWYWNLNAAGGENKIKKNINIPDELYDGVDLKTKVFEGSLDLKNYIPLASKFVYHWQIMAALMSRVNYFENDLYRLGGLKSIRGFNEDSFRASKYVIGRQEFQFIPSRNTSIYLFYDMAWYEKEVQETKTSDKPMGYGFGFNFSAGTGLFTLNYALGKQDGETANLKFAKIHFGFIAKF